MGSLCERCLTCGLRVSVGLSACGCAVGLRGDVVVGQCYVSTGLCAQSKGLGMRVVGRVLAASTAALVVGSGLLVASPAVSAATSQEELLQVLDATDALAQDGLEVRIRGFPAAALPASSGTVILGQTSWGYKSWRADTNGSLQAFNDGSTQGVTVEVLAGELATLGKAARSLFERGVDAAGIADDAWVVDMWGPGQVSTSGMSPPEDPGAGREVYLSDLFKFVKGQVATADSVTSKRSSGGRVVYTVRVSGVRSAISFTTQAGLVTKYSNRAKGGFSFDVLGLGDKVTAPDFASLDTSQSERVLRYAMSIADLHAVASAAAVAAPQLVPPGGRLAIAHVRQAVEGVVQGRGGFAVVPLRTSIRVTYVSADLVSDGFPEPCMSLRVSRGAVSAAVCS